MDSMETKSNTDPSFLTECVSDAKSAQEAADSTLACWTEAEGALAPVIGREGLGVVFRHGEEVAERIVQGAAPPVAHASIDGFCEWVRSLSAEQALSVCKSFLVSVEDFLLSLLGSKVLARLLRRARTPAPSNFTK